MYEVVIIGAGISGSYLAKILNEKKIRVLIIEKVNLQEIVFY